MKKLMPVLLAILGLCAGLGGGYVLRPSAGSSIVHDAAAADPATDDHAAPAREGDGHAEAAMPDEAASGHDDGAEGSGLDYVKLSHQFIVPVVEEGRVASMVILSLTLEVTAGSTEAIFAMEPRLRDHFLQVLFDHANAGGFRGSFTDGANLIILRRALLEVAHKAAGEKVIDVLIADIARQDN